MDVQNNKHWIYKSSSFFVLILSIENCIICEFNWKKNLTFIRYRKTGLNLAYVINLSLRKVVNLIFHESSNILSII